MANNFTNFNAHMEPMDLVGHPDGLDDEDDIIDTGNNASDTNFDLTIGHIEDIIMSDQFQRVQNDFLEKYYGEFDDSDENKFIYTDIHQEYAQLVEKLLEDELTKCMPDFQMEEFQHELVLRKDELDSEIFEILLTFSDFLVFKEMMLDYKIHKEGGGIDLTNGIKITAFSPPDDSVSPAHRNGHQNLAGGAGGDRGTGIHGTTFEFGTRSSPSPGPSANATASSRRREEDVNDLGSDLDLLVVGKAIRPKPDK